MNIDSTAETAETVAALESPTELGAPLDSTQTESIHAWSLEDSTIPDLVDYRHAPSRRRFYIQSAAALIAVAVLAGGAVFEFRHKPSVTPPPSAKPAAAPTSRTVSAPPGLAEQIPYWPDGAYLELVASNCEHATESPTHATGVACIGPVTQAALHGCQSSECRERRAEIIAIGHAVCLDLKTMSPAQDFRIVTTPNIRDYAVLNAETAKALINSAMAAYCPRAAAEPLS